MVEAIIIPVRTGSTRPSVRRQSLVDGDLDYTVVIVIRHAGRRSGLDLVIKLDSIEGGRVEIGIGRGGDQVAKQLVRFIFTGGDEGGGADMDRVTAGIHGVPHRIGNDEGAVDRVGGARRPAIGGQHPHAGLEGGASVGDQLAHRVGGDDGGISLQVGIHRDRPIFEIADEVGRKGRWNGTKGGGNGRHLVGATLDENEAGGGRKTTRENQKQDPSFHGALLNPTANSVPHFVILNRTKLRPTNNQRWKCQPCCSGFLPTGAKAFAGDFAPRNWDWGL